MKEVSLKWEGQETMSPVPPHRSSYKTVSPIHISMNTVIWQIIYTIDHKNHTKFEALEIDTPGPHASSLQTKVHP